jgi:hypothetical protein
MKSSQPQSFSLNSSWNNFILLSEKNIGCFVQEMTENINEQQTGAFSLGKQQGLQL